MHFYKLYVLKEKNILISVHYLTENHPRHFYMEIVANFFFYLDTTLPIFVCANRGYNSN